MTFVTLQTLPAVSLPLTPAQDRPGQGAGQESHAPGGGREDSVLVSALSRADDVPVIKGASRSLLHWGRRHGERSGICEARYGQAPGVIEEQEGGQRGQWKGGGRSECQQTSRAPGTRPGPR